MDVLVARGDIAMLLLIVLVLWTLLRLCMVDIVALVAFALVGLLLA